MGWPKENVVILDGARTPFGRFMGSLRSLSATELGALAAREALARARVEPAQVDQLIFGNVLQTSADASFIARHVELKADIPEEASALMVNRNCGSGLEAVLTGAKTILAGEADCILAGGAENMSQAPYVLRGARDGWGLGRGQLEDSLLLALTDSYNDLPMGLTAENLAAKYEICREEQDAFALLSQQRAVAARESGRLAQEIVHVEVEERKKVNLVEHDEHLRPETTLEKLTSLRPAFRKDGTVTAGNASGINDGAAAVVVCHQAQAAKEGWQPIARLVSWATSGVNPDFMGIGPVPAIRLALERAGLTLDQIDLIEVNEAFAAQYLAVEKALGFERERANVNGGAIALGHPLGASGARVLLTLLYELVARNARFGVASLCIGGGQGIAAVVENLRYER